MICPDCELEVDKLTTRGICRSCYKRYYGEMKRKGYYLPIKDLKGTIEYNRAMGRRLATIEKNKNKDVKPTKRGRPSKLDNLFKTKAERILEERAIKTDVVEDTTPTIKESKPAFNESVYNDYLAKVNNDIDLAFKNNNLTQDYLKYSDISKWIDMFFNLLQIDGFITDSRRAKAIFNGLRIDYQHCLESLDIEDTDSILKWGYMSKILLDLRRPTAEIVDYCDILDPIIKYLQKDSDFLALLREARDKAEERSIIHKSHTYYTRESELVREEDFVIGKATKPKLFDCTVMCSNLFGNPDSQLFRLNGGIKALNKEEAYNKFKSFLKEKFDSLVYYDDDINVREVNSVRDIPSSGCL
jgi:hypothetical protein